MTLQPYIIIVQRAHRRDVSHCRSRRQPLRQGRATLLLISHLHASFRADGRRADDTRRLSRQIGRPRINCLALSRLQLRRRCPFDPDHAPTTPSLFAQHPPNRTSKRTVALPQTLSLLAIAPYLESSDNRCAPLAIIIPTTRRRHVAHSRRTEHGLRPHPQSLSYSL